MDRSNASKRNVSFIIFGTLAALVIFLSLFQNCSKVAFQTNDDANKALGVVAQGCTDSNNQPHDSGSTWQTTSNSTQNVTCADSASMQQGYVNTTSYLCQDASITVTGTSSQLVSPTATCPAPVLNAMLNPANPQSGGSSQLMVSTQAVHDVQYSCKNAANGNVFSSGALSVGSETRTLANINQDLTCQISAQTQGAPLTQTLSVSVDCESSGLLKDPQTKTCVEFKCQSYQALAPRSDGTYEVPSRTSAGVCYSVKLMSAIPNSASNLTKSKDNDIISRNHDAGGNYTIQWSPYQLGRSNLNFIMDAGGGARKVELSGSGQAASSIRVDNFLVVGLAKQKTGLSSNSAYRSYGTSDSTIDSANTYIQFRNLPLNLTSFGSGGTSTISALDITTQVSTVDPYSLEVRALDCGHIRELSDIYLVFQ